MFVVGELVWVRNGLFLHSLNAGFGLVIQVDKIDLDESIMISWKVLLHGKLVEVDASHLKQLKWYNKHLLCLDGSQGRVT